MTGTMNQDKLFNKMIFTYHEYGKIDYDTYRLYILLRAKELIDTYLGLDELGYYVEMDKEGTLLKDNPTQEHLHKFAKKYLPFLKEYSAKYYRMSRMSNKKIDELLNEKGLGIVFQGGLTNTSTYDNIEKS